MISKPSIYISPATITTSSLSDIKHFATTCRATARLKSGEEELALDQVIALQEFSFKGSLAQGLVLEAPYICTSFDHIAVLKVSYP